MYYGLAHFTAEQGMRAAYEELAYEKSTVRTDASLPPYQDFDTLMGIQAHRTIAETYGALA